MKENAFVLALFVILFNACNNPTSVKTEEKQPTVSSELKSVKVIDNISYREGNSKSWKLDLATPENFGTTPRPAIVIVHGGGWRAGSKKDLVTVIYYSITHFRDILLFQLNIGLIRKLHFLLVLRT